MKLVCPIAHHAKPAVAVMDDVMFEERRGHSYAVRMKTAERALPLSCRVALVRGRFALVFVDADQTTWRHSILLLNRHRLPDARAVLT